MLIIVCSLYLFGLLKSYWPIMSSYPNCLPPCQCLPNYWVSATNTLMFEVTFYRMDWTYGIEMVLIKPGVQNLSYQFLMAQPSNKFLCPPFCPPACLFQAAIRRQRQHSLRHFYECNHSDHLSQTALYTVFCISRKVQAIHNTR